MSDSNVLNKSNHSLTMETIAEFSPLLSSSSSERRTTSHSEGGGGGGGRRHTDHPENSLEDYDVEYVVSIRDKDREVSHNTNNTNTNHNASSSSFFFVFAESVTGTLDYVSEQVTETFGSVTDLAHDAAGTVTHAIQEEMVGVKDAWLGELQQADESQSKFFVMDMNLTRGLSLLPGDVVDLAHLTGNEHDNNFLQSMIVLPHSHSRTDLTTTATDSLGTSSHNDLSPLLTTDRKTVYDATTAAVVTKTPMDQDGGGGDFHKPGESHKGDDDSSSHIPFSAYLLLLSAILSLSSIGPLLNVQSDVDSTLKITWRKTCTSIMLLPLAARVLYQHGLPHLTPLQWIVFVVTSICYAGQTVTYAWSLDYTSVGNATILGNSQAMILLLGKVCMGDRISQSEGLGAILAFVGAILCSRDSADSRDTPIHSAAGVPTTGSTLLGDGYALASSICGVFFITFAKRIRPNMDLSVFMFVIMFLGTLDTLVFLGITGSQVTFDRNALHGVFGWMNFTWNRLPIEIMIAVVCNVFGAMGYVRAMHYFSNLVILVAGLCEPVAAELIAVLIGVGVLPGWKGWIGNALVMIGTISVVYKPSVPVKHGTKETATDHV